MSDNGCFRRCAFNCQHWEHVIVVIVTHKRQYFSLYVAFWCVWHLVKALHLYTASTIQCPGHLKVGPSSQRNWVTQECWELSVYAWFSHARTFKVMILRCLITFMCQLSFRPYCLPVCKVGSVLAIALSLWKASLLGRGRVGWVSVPGRGRVGQSARQGPMLRVTFYVDSH